MKFDENGLIPAIVQDNINGQVLMLGYMNKEAVLRTKESGKVTFFSRSKQRIWVKGETSGNFLLFRGIQEDCDQDALLIKAEPIGPTCHKGTATCWGDANIELSVNSLEKVIELRRKSGDETSYVNKLFNLGINKIAQKVGEEAVETVIEAMDSNDKLFLEESADLFFHYLVLLQAKGYKFSDVLDVLQQRNK